MKTIIKFCETGKVIKKKFRFIPFLLSKNVDIKFTAHHAFLE